MPGAARRALAAAAAGALLLSAAACGGGPTDRGGSGGHRVTSVSDLGAVPIPTAPAADPTATARPGRPAILEMGAAVDARIGHGTHAVLTVLGPEQGTTRPGARSTSGTFTVKVAARTGTLTVAVADFSSRNETGVRVRLRPVGPSAVTATPGRPRVLRLVGRYASGAAQVTYRHDRAFVAIWDFNIELD